MRILGAFVKVLHLVSVSGISCPMHSAQERLRQVARCLTFYDMGNR